MTKEVFTKEFTKYIAYDGSEFKSELECITYEHTKSFIKPGVQLWAVYTRQSMSIELFSSEELAKLSLKYVENQSKFIIRPIEIDARFIYDNGNKYPEYIEVKEDD